MVEVGLFFLKVLIESLAVCAPDVKLPKSLLPGGGKGVRSRILLYSDVNVGVSFSALRYAVI